MSTFKILFPQFLPHSSCNPFLPPSFTTLIYPRFTPISACFIPSFPTPIGPSFPLLPFYFHSFPPKFPTLSLRFSVWRSKGPLTRVNLGCKWGIKDVCGGQLWDTLIVDPGFKEGGGSTGGKSGKKRWTGTEGKKGSTFSASRKFFNWSLNWAIEGF